MTVLLLTVDDIEVAIGRPPVDATEEARWQSQIESISAFICSYCDDSFQLLEDDVIRCQADYYGRISLGAGPVSDVASVASFRTGEEVRSIWDGMNTVAYLEPLQVVDVTYTHGYEDVPDDIKSLAKDAVIAINGLGATGPVTEYKVGDVSEKYSTALSNSSGTAVVTLSRSVLRRYKDVHATWNTGGFGRYPDAVA